MIECRGWKGPMSYGLRDFLKTATNTFADDAKKTFNLTGAPGRIASNHVHAFMSDLEQLSEMHLLESFRRKNICAERVNIYQKFIQFKSHFASSPDRDGKYVYYFLCSIEALSMPDREQYIYQMTAQMDAEPEKTIRQISKLMRKLNQAQMQSLENRQLLAIGN